MDMFNILFTRSHDDKGLESGGLGRAVRVRLSISLLTPARYCFMSLVKIIGNLLRMQGCGVQIFIAQPKFFITDRFCVKHCKYFLSWEALTQRQKITKMQRLFGDITPLALLACDCF